MLRLFSTIRKELIILLRDRGGLAIMFLMPMALITIMALIQDAPFRDYQEMEIPLLLVNNDTGSLGKTIEEGLKESKIFKINKSEISESETGKSIAKGNYEIGIFIPEDASQKLKSKVDQFVSTTLAKSGLSDSVNATPVQNFSNLNINVYFAPDIKKSFKVSILSSLRQFSSKLETQTLLDIFTKELNKTKDQTGTVKQEIGEFVVFNDQNVSENQKGNFHLNSVQHNVPAWTMFGMFFIVISMAGSIIKERDDGSYLRIRTMPGSYVTVMAGKITAYLSICLIQCLLMLLIGMYFLPLIGLPKLIIGSSIPAIALVAVFSGLAATGYGIMVGTLFNTHQQASTFGAISVVILAALGGIWIPVYVMPEYIRHLAEFSPLYWGLNAFHDIFLRFGTVSTIVPYALKLLVFCFVTICIAYLFNRSRNK